MSYRVLLVEDEPLVAERLSRALKGQGHEVAVANTLADAGAWLERAAEPTNSPWDVVLLDLRLPDGDGETLIEGLQRLPVPPAVAVLSGVIDSERVLRLNLRGIIAIPKPLTPETLLNLVDTLGAGERCLFEVEAFAKEHRLSQRESELLRLAAVGVADREAAERMKCVLGTIGTYWKRILRKTESATQRQALLKLCQFSLSRRFPLRAK